MMTKIEKEKMVDAEAIGWAIYAKLQELGIAHENIAPEYYDAIATVAMQRMEELGIIETDDNPELKAKIIENYKKTFFS